MIDFSVEDFGILYQAPKWPVLYDEYIGKSIVVSNLQVLGSGFHVTL